MPDRSWLNPRMAKARLESVEKQIEQLESERSVLRMVLGVSGPQVARSLPGGLSLAQEATRIMAAGAKRKGWTVSELVTALEKTDPARARRGNASALMSSALIQAMRSPASRFVASGGGGRGKPRRYRLK